MKSCESSVGRPRSFELADALDKAMTVFWDHGYAGTSYPALEAATGLHRQSLRYAFGDKAALFERVIDHYADRKVGAVAEILNRSGAAVDNLQSVFDLWSKDANHTSRKGCLMVNALAELGSDQLMAASAVDRANRTLIDAFTHAFKVAQAQGTIRTDLDPQVLASQAIAMGDGFMVHSRYGSVSQLADTAFAGFLRQIAV